MTCDPARAVRDRLEHPELRSALGVAAKVHTLFWRHGDNPGARASLVAEVGQTGAFWTQDKQDLPTNDHLESTWGRFVDLFGPALEEAVGEGAGMEKIVSIGKRMAAAHPVVTRHLRESKDRTLLHGDLKAANMMWPEAGAGAAGRLAPDQPPPLLIDWEWVGMGVAAQDVAYLLASSGRSSCPSPSPPVFGWLDARCLKPPPPSLQHQQITPCRRSNACASPSVARLSWCYVA